MCAYAVSITCLSLCLKCVETLDRELTDSIQIVDMTFLSQNPSLSSINMVTRSGFCNINSDIQTHIFQGDL